MIRFSHHDESFLLTKIISQGYVTPKYYPVPKLCTGITVVPINCWKRSLCYKCYPCLFRLCSSSCSFKYEHYAYSVNRIFFIYTAPLIPQQMTLTFLQPSKKKKATVLFAEKEYMYMYVFSDTCKLIKDNKNQIIHADKIYKTSVGHYQYMYKRHYTLKPIIR